MAVLITDECISCNAYEVECPDDAIYGAGDSWLLGGESNEAFHSDHTYIAHEKCTECVGFYDEPQCISACPTDAIVMDTERVETKEQLLTKKEHLDKVGR